MKRIGLKLAIIGTALCSTIPVFAAQTTVKILHTNDTHSNVKDDGKSIIGFAKLATFVETEKANGNVLMLDAGDMFQGLPFANIEKGHSIVEIVNQVGYDAMTIGNHEFDFGADNLMSIMDKLNYPVIAANVLKGEEQAVQPYIVKEFDDVKVGVFGMATPETAFKTHPDNVVGYTFADIIETADATVKTLKETEKVDIVVMLSHLGLEEGDYTSDLVAKGVEGIDVIVDGHSHTTLPEGRMEGETLIVSTGTALKDIGQVELVVEDGKVVSKTATLLGYEAFNEVAPKQEIIDAIAKVEEAQKPMLEKVVGTTEVKLVGDREVVRTGESNLGQLATDAMIELTGADVAITNGGGIRASIEAGDITMNNMVTVFPFGNTIMVKEIKGSDLLAALEYGVDSFPETKGAFPHTAGITFTLNAYKEAGSRVSDVKVSGEALDLNKMYLVATNDFMAAGGDGYTMFESYPIKAEYNTLMDTLLAYVEKLGTVEGTFVPRMTVVTEAPVEEVIPSTEITQPTVESKVVALRAYLQDKGFKVTFDDVEKVVTAEKADTVLTFKSNSKAYTAKDADSNESGELSAALVVKENVTYINATEVEAILAKLTPAA
ncbi:bifunctional metallophosphatase/5'-nucleotidase [Niameybacter massiliensis]|uniref:bifunctional metallophosphatase/5'-nucleotidase n=1 Tax=Niameybacter massiliensis TaxID=1658108 RepID=UPI0006B60E9C|nr:5'-nucleotidase C-terminal domain-containing protein [Niameybacter massiliensis]